MVAPGVKRRLHFSPQLRLLVSSRRRLTKRRPARTKRKSAVPFTCRQRSSAVETAKILVAAGISIRPEFATPFIEPI